MADTPQVSLILGASLNASRKITEKFRIQNTNNGPSFGTRWCCALNIVNACFLVFTTVVAGLWGNM